MINIIGLGDIMPGGVLNGTTNKFVSKDVKSLLAKGDIRVGTLETAVGNSPTFYSEKMKRKADVIYVEDKDLLRLKQLNINLVSLANNHFFDLGPEGALHTISLLDELGIMHCGAGKNIEEASQPVVINKEGYSIAFIAFCDWRPETTGWCPIATPTSPGVNPLYDDYVKTQIIKYKKKYDYLVVIPHWGREYDYWPSNNVYKSMKIMMRAGANLILGGHTHCPQPIINNTKCSVVFSLGNFFFPDRLIIPPRSTFYPHPAINISELKTTFGYPYVKETTLKLWKPIARIGMICNTSIDENIVTTKVIYTYLNKDNFIDIRNLPKNLDNKIKLVRFLLRFKLYPYIYLLIRGYRYIKNKIHY